MWCPKGRCFTSSAGLIFVDGSPLLLIWNRGAEYRTRDSHMPSSTLRHKHVDFETALVTLAEGGNDLALYMGAVKSIQSTFRRSVAAFFDTLVLVLQTLQKADDGQYFEMLALAIQSAQSAGQFFNIAANFNKAKTNIPIYFNRAMGNPEPMMNGGLPATADSDPLWTGTQAYTCDANPWTYNCRLPNTPIGGYHQLP